MTCWIKTGLDICWPWQNQKLTPCCQESRTYGCKVIVFTAKALSVSTKDNQSHSNPSPDLSLLDSWWSLDPTYLFTFHIILSFSNVTYILKSCAIFNPFSLYGSSADDIDIIDIVESQKQKICWYCQSVLKTYMALVNRRSKSLCIQHVSNLFNDDYQKSSCCSWNVLWLLLKGNVS